MEKNQLIDQIHQLEEQMGKMYTDLGVLKQHLIRLLEENKKLGLENDQMRKIYAEMQHQPTKVGEVPPVGEGYDNLARIYNEGFHICNVYFGHLRTEGDCLFCLSFLSKNEND